MTDQQWLTEADLAARMGGDNITAEQVAIWRRAYGWPSIKIGRQHRFTPEHVAEIARMQEQRGTRKPKAEKAGRAAIPGQTARSAARGGGKR